MNLLCVEGKISDIKNKISILGSGDLEIGFERIDEIKICNHL